MDKDSEVAKLIEFANAGHHAMVMGAPIREGMSTPFVSPEASGLFDFAARRSRKKNSRTDLAANKVVIGKSGEGMSFPYKSRAARSDTTPAGGLLAGLLRRL